MALTEGLSVALSSTPMSRSTALVLGWEGSKASQLSVVAKLYKDLAFNVVMSTVRPLLASSLTASLF